MALQLAPFADVQLDEALLELLIEEHESIAIPRLERLWRYYRNALAEPDDQGGSRNSPAQWVGLPLRLMNSRRARHDDRLQREIVIENDIAWRIHTLVDFMFPAPPTIVSRAADHAKRRDVETILSAIIDASGGMSLWQTMATLGAVYGHVDLLINTDELASPAARRLRRQIHSNQSTDDSNGPSGAQGDRLSEGSPAAAQELPGGVPSNPVEELAGRIASMIMIETVEAPRAIPLLSPADYRVLDAYIITFEQMLRDVSADDTLQRLTRAVTRRFHSRATRTRSIRSRQTQDVIEIISATRRQRYEDGRLVDESINQLGRVPIVHIQNLVQPLRFEGMSDVEPLIPLQDELNTRLSDRANRVTMQSFRMWLGKGIDGFTERPVGPGQMWVTDNPNASIEAFGGDAVSPGEEAHIEELREAIDKASGVTPAAAGHIKAKVGNLTSENALRISLMGTIAKIKRKRVTYGQGIEQLCDLILHALDVHGVYRTRQEDRRINIVWPDPLPVDESRRITDALAKAQLGVPLNKLRAELGYPDEDAVTQA